MRCLDDATADADDESDEDGRTASLIVEERTNCDSLAVSVSVQSENDRDVDMGRAFFDSKIERKFFVMATGESVE